MSYFFQDLLTDFNEKAKGLEDSQIVLSVQIERINAGKAIKMAILSNLTITDCIYVELQMFGELLKDTSYASHLNRLNECKRRLNIVHNNLMSTKDRLQRIEEVVK